MKTILILIFTMFAVSLQAVSIGNLFDAIEKQPSTKIDEISSKMANIAQKRVNAGYYPRLICLLAIHTIIPQQILDRLILWQQEH